MAKRIVNPDCDDLGYAGVELDADEFGHLLDYLDATGFPPHMVRFARRSGFIVPIRRTDATERVFLGLSLQSDVMILAVCRDGSLGHMRDFIAASSPSSRLRLIFEQAPRADPADY